MVIQRCEPEILKWQLLQPFERVFDRNPPFADLPKQPLEPFRIHRWPFSGFASRSMRSLTALRQDFPSNNTALIS